MKRRDLPTPLTRIEACLAAGGLTNAALSTHLAAATGGTDVAGAWSRRQAHDFVQAAAILADGAALAPENPALRLAALAAPFAPVPPRPGARSVSRACRRSPPPCRRPSWRRPRPRSRPRDAALEPSAATGALAHVARRAGRAARAERDRPLPGGVPRGGVRDLGLAARRRARGRPPRPAPRGRRGADEPALRVVRLAERRPHRRAAPRPQGPARRGPAPGGLRGAPARAPTAPDRDRLPPASTSPCRAPCSAGWAPASRRRCSSPTAAWAIPRSRCAPWRRWRRRWP